MRDPLIAAIRTGMAVAVTTFAAWLASRFGIEIDVAGLTEALFVIAVGVVNFILNKLTEKFPWIGAFMSLGMSKSTPTY